MKEEGYRTKEQKGRQTNNDERSRDHGRERGWTEALGAGLAKGRAKNRERGKKMKFRPILLKNCGSFIKYMQRVLRTLRTNLVYAENSLRVG